MPRVVITEFMDESALDRFGPGYQVDYAPGLVDDRDGLLGAVARADGLIVRNRTRVDAEVLAAAPALRVVGRLGVGLENIDLDACAARDVVVCPASGANTQSVVEYVIGAMLQLRRKVFGSGAAVAAGAWPRAALGQGGEVCGRTLGLVGYGAIAQAVAVAARALGMEIAAYDPFLPDGHPAWSGTDRCDLPELLGRADVLSLHVPLTAETKGLIDAEALAGMKPEAIVINTARGGVIDETALVQALHAGRIAGAALDVFATEPLTPEAGAVFNGCPNLILTPHVAGVTGEANARVSLVTVDNVRAVLDGPQT